MGDLPEAAVATGVAAVGGWLAARQLASWARGRCDEALAAARSLPESGGRSLAVLATLDGRPLTRARARDLRALQQALDDERRDGALLARRAVPTVRPPDARG